MPKTYLAKEQEINHRIVSLFWEGNLQQKWSLFLTYFARIPAFTIQNVAVPLYVAYGLEAIVTRHFSIVPHYALIILLLTMGYGALIAIGAWSIGHNGTTAYSYIEQKVFDNFLHKDYEFYSNAFFGALGAQAIRIREAGSQYGKIVTQDIPKQAVTVVAGLAVIAYNAPFLALITFLCMLFVLSYTALSSRWRLGYLRKLGEADSELAGIIGDTLSHSTTVKSFAAEDYESQRLTPILRFWKRAQFRSWMATIPGDAGRNILSALTISILLILTANLYQNNRISIAIVTLVQLYVIKMITVTQDITDTIKEYEQVMGGSYAAMKTMLVPRTIQDKTEAKDLDVDHPKNSITFKNITFSYPDSGKGVKAVNNFSLQINKGEKIGLVGYSGSGKTTITKLLLRFIDVNSGSIQFDKLDIRDIQQKSLRRAIAYVPQEPLLFHRSIADNIAYGKPGASKKTIIKAAKMANVDEFVNELPKQYETLVGERGVKLSGGQRQRVAIARAILKDAPVLVLDEATSALDSRSEKLIQEALWNLMKDRTALVIAHRLSTIQRMDRIAVMDKGKIVQLGTHQELLKQKSGIYARLWAHQSGGYLVTDPEKI